MEIGKKQKIKQRILLEKTNDKSVVIANRRKTIFDWLHGTKDKLKTELQNVPKWK